MKKSFQAFLYALNGFVLLIKTERNFRIAAVCAALAIATGIALDFVGEHLFRLEWALIFLAIGIVMVSEALNSALEKALDLLYPDRHPMVGMSKDMAAGATLVASTIALLIGAYVLLPHIISALS